MSITLYIILEELTSHCRINISRIFVTLGLAGYWTLALGGGHWRAPLGNDRQPEGTMRVGGWSRRWWTFLLVTSHPYCASSNTTGHHQEGDTTGLKAHLLGTTRQWALVGSRHRGSLPGTGDPYWAPLIGSRHQQAAGAGLH